MNWLLRHRIQLYLRNSIWIYPSLAIVAGLIAVSLLSRLERFLGWRINLNPETARVVMATVATSLLTLVVLVTSAMLLAVQLASAQLTPRIIAFVYRNNTRKLLLSLFVFTFTFSVGVLVRIEDSVPMLSGYFAAYGFLLNLALMLYFIDGVGKTLRPSSVLRVMGLSGREVIAGVYPRRLDEQQASSPEPIAALNGKPDRIIVNSVGGSVLAFDLKGLMSLAEQSDCLIELIHRSAISLPPVIRCFKSLRAVKISLTRFYVNQWRWARSVRWNRIQCSPFASLLI